MNEPKAPEDAPLQVLVDGGKLVISIGISTLAYCTDWENGGPLKDCKVDGRKLIQWAKSVAYEIERERESGATPLTDLLERAMQEAADSGSPALIYPKKARRKTAAVTTDSGRK